MWLYTEPDTAQKEILSSWALFILIMLLIIALFASYMLQHKKIQAVHETVLSIFAGRAPKESETIHFVLTALGMVAGLVIKLTEGTFIQTTVSFNQGFFFNLLLPPIILASGYELHQVNTLHISRRTSPNFSLGKLLQEHRHHLDIRFCWDVYFRHRFRAVFMAMDTDSPRRLQDLICGGYICWCHLVCYRPSDHPRNFQYLQGRPKTLHRNLRRVDSE